MKEQILKSLETMNKAELSKEIGISVFILNKFISDKMETIKTEYLDKVKSYYGEEELPKQDGEEKPLDKSSNRVTLSVTIPELTEGEVKFFNSLKLDSLKNKISALGYINYVFTSSSKFTQPWYKRLAVGKTKLEVESLVERLGLAVLCGKYNVKESDKTWVIKLPSEHYLCKYDDGDIGWSVEPNQYTVTSKNKEILGKEYPEYIDFITDSDALVKSYNRKNRGFSISERIRDKN